jgi:hypothetical protein
MVEELSQLFDHLSSTKNVTKDVFLNPIKRNQSNVSKKPKPVEVTKVTKVVKEKHSQKKDYDQMISSLVKKDVQLYENILLFRVSICLSISAGLTIVPIRRLIHKLFKTS